MSENYLSKALEFGCLSWIGVSRHRVLCEDYLKQIGRLELPACKKSVRKSCFLI